MKPKEMDMKVNQTVLRAVGVMLAASVSTAVHAAEYVIAISPDIASKEARRFIGASTMAFLFSPQVKLGDRLTVVNGSDLSQVARFAIPEHPQYRNEASRRKHLEKPTAEFTRFMAKGPEGAGAQVASGINVPKILEEVSAVVPGASEGKLEVLVIGNPIYASGVGAGTRRAHAVIYIDRAALMLPDTGFRKTELLYVGAAARGHQNALGFEHLLAPIPVHDKLSPLHRTLARLIAHAAND
jgi:hypothetical protein